MRTVLFSSVQVTSAVTKQGAKDTSSVAQSASGYRIWFYPGIVGFWCRQALLVMDHLKLAKTKRWKPNDSKTQTMVQFTTTGLVVVAALRHVSRIQRYVTVLKYSDFTSPCK